MRPRAKPLAHFLAHNHNAIRCLHLFTSMSSAATSFLPHGLTIPKRLSFLIGNRHHIRTLTNLWPDSARIGDCLTLNHILFGGESSKELLTCFPPPLLTRLIYHTHAEETRGKSQYLRKKSLFSDLSVPRQYYWAFAAVSAGTSYFARKPAPVEEISEIMESEARGYAFSGVERKRLLAVFAGIESIAVLLLASPTLRSNSPQ